MTTQHVPHTPMWRRVLSLPHSRLGWWAVGLVGIYGVLYATVDFSDRLSVLGTVVASGGSVVHGLVFGTWALLGVAGAVVALLLSHELSALVWLAMVAGLPAFLVAGFLGLVLKDTLALEISTLPLITAVVVLITVLISVLISWRQRHRSGKPR